MNPAVVDLFCLHLSPILEICTTLPHNDAVPCRDLGISALVGFMLRLRLRHHEPRSINDYNTALFLLVDRALMVHMLAASLRQRLLSTNARMAGPKLTLYVDTVSPFSYEAYYILRVSSLDTPFG